MIPLSYVPMLNQAFFLGYFPAVKFNVAEAVFVYSCFNFVVVNYSIQAMLKFDDALYLVIYHTVYNKLVSMLHTAVADFVITNVCFEQNSVLNISCHSQGSVALTLDAIFRLLLLAVSLLLFVKR